MEDYFQAARMRVLKPMPTVTHRLQDYTYSNKAIHPNRATPWTTYKPAQSKSKLGRKGLILLTLAHHSSSSKEVRTGTQARLKPGSRR
jgi:Lhr-like helicase